MTKVVFEQEINGVTEPRIWTAVSGSESLLIHKLFPFEIPPGGTPKKFWVWNTISPLPIGSFALSLEGALEAQPTWFATQQIINAFKANPHTQPSEVIIDLPEDP